MTATSNSKINSATRTPLKTYVYIALISIVLTLVYKTISSITEVLDERWQERGPAYDVKWQYMQSMALAATRVTLLKEKYDPDGIVLSTLEAWHHKVYDSALEKIPANDIERALFWQQYILVPAMLGQMPVEKLVNDIYANLLLLEKGQAKTVYVKKIDRFSILADLLIAYRIYIEKFDITQQKLEEFDEIFLHVSSIFLFDEDAKYILSIPRDASIALKYNLSIQDFILHLFFRRRHDTESCPKKLIKNWIIVNNQTKKILATSESKNLSSIIDINYKEQMLKNMSEGSMLIKKYYPACINILGEKNG